MRMHSWALVACWLLITVSASSSRALKCQGCPASQRAIAADQDHVRLRLHRRGRSTSSTSSESSAEPMTDFEKLVATRTEETRRTRAAATLGTADTGKLKAPAGGHAGASPAAGAGTSADGPASLDRFGAQSHADKQGPRKKARLADHSVPVPSASSGGKTSLEPGHGEATSSHRRPDAVSAIIEKKRFAFKHARLVQALQREVRQGQRESEYRRDQEYLKAFTAPVPTGTSQSRERYMRTMAEARVLRGYHSWPTTKDWSRTPALAPSITRQELVRQHPHLREYAERQEAAVKVSARKNGKQKPHGAAESSASKQ